MEPRVIRRLELTSYDPVYGDQFLWVWVNPPSSVLDALRPYRVQAPTSGPPINWLVMAMVFSIVWSMGPEDIHLTALEVLELLRDAEEQGQAPGLFAWLVAQTLKMIDDYKPNPKPRRRRHLH